MKSYPLELLDTRPDDSTPVALPDSPRLRSLWPVFQAELADGLTWIAGTIKSVKQAEDETVFDSLYRRGHVLAGMTALLRLPKLGHLLALLDFGLDLGRALQTFETHSLGYVIHLLATTALGVTQELTARQRCETDLTDIVEECRTYLSAPMSQTVAAKPQPPVPTPPAPTQPAPPPPAKEPAAPSVVAPANAAAADGYPSEEDGPEELDIPSDKIGLTSDFCEESRENLAQVGHRLVELESADDALPIVNDLFRSVHTVKGGARLLKVGKMEALAHRMESLLDEVRKGKRKVTAAMIDVLLEGKRLLEEMVTEVASRGPIHTRVAPWLAAMAAVESGQTPVPTATPMQVPAAPVAPVAAMETPKPEARPAAKAEGPTKTASSSESIRIPTEKLDEVLNTASEVFISRIRLGNDVAEIGSAVQQFKQTLNRVEEFSPEAILNRLAESNRRLVGDLRATVTGSRGRLSFEKLHVLVNRFHEELSSDIDQRGYSPTEEMMLNLLSIDAVRKRLQKNVEQLEQLSSRLQTGAMSFRMVPISHLFDRFPTQVREMARQVGKTVRLDVSGGHTELDKVMINQLTDPLLHILRNGVDHGIELPADRVAKGKPETGRISLRAYYHGSHAVIEISDDGKGIDASRVLTKAIQAGLVEADKAASLTPLEIFAFIFEPGLSTAEKLSTLSGRGVGMDVVKTAINQVQGSISIESAPGVGTTMRIKLPLTLAVVGILLVRERALQFAFPIQHVDQILMVRRQEIRQVSENTIYNYRGTTLQVTTLSAILDFPPSPFAEEAALVILSEGEKKVGILVDAVLGRQDVLIKNLGRLLKKAPFVMGCTILSDSQLVLILNAWEIVNTRNRGALTLSRPAQAGPASEQRRTVLVVDDSPIQRKHLGAMLGQAGYAVETAENGFEALKRLRGRHYTAFCVDVVMPLMDGFEFVERLRRTPGYADSPVLFITSRVSQTELDRAVPLGKCEFFQKPIDSNRLMQVLAQHSQDGGGFLEPAHSERTTR